MNSRAEHSEEKQCRLHLGWSDFAQIVQTLDTGQTQLASQRKRLKSALLQLLSFIVCCVNFVSCVVLMMLQAAI